jgi:hypothetical protein
MEQQIVTIWDDDSVTDALDRIRVALAEIGVLTKVFEQKQEFTSCQFVRVEYKK